MRRLFNLWSRFPGALLLINLLSMHAMAGVFTVSPVRISVSVGRPNAVVQIENLSLDAVTIQAHVVSWSFQGPVDSYTDTDEILLNPPIFSLQPHQKQFLRLGLRRGNTSETEHTYRLILEQVPEPPKLGFSGFTTVLRISVPIFSLPGNKVSPQISWRAERTATGVKIVAVNHGSAHVQFKDFELKDAEHQGVPLSRTLTDYLLPGQTKAWEFDDERVLQSGQISFKAKTDAGEMRDALVPQHP